MKKFLVLIVSAMLIQPNILFAAEGKKMTRSDICKKNYEKLFNSDWNPNVGSDPEMMAILQKYIFGEVFTVGNLDMKTREMLTVTSLAVQQTLPQLKAHINAARSYTAGSPRNPLSMRAFHRISKNTQCNRCNE